MPIVYISHLLMIYLYLFLYAVTPLIVAVSSGRHMTCNIICNISYGIDPNLEFLPNTNTSGPAGVELTQLVEGEENFYVVSADIGSLTVKVKGSRDLRIGTVF